MMWLADYHWLAGWGYRVVRTVIVATPVLGPAWLLPLAGCVYRDVADVASHVIASSGLEGIPTVHPST